MIDETQVIGSEDRETCTCGRTATWGHSQCYACLHGMPPESEPVRVFDPAPTARLVASHLRREADKEPESVRMLVLQDAEWWARRAR